MILSLLQWIQNTAFFTSLRASAYAYPIVLALHLSAIAVFGGMIFLTSAGYIVQATGSYMILFIICGSAYLVALGLMTLLTAHAKPVDL